MNDYRPIIYIWVEIPCLPSTKEQFMLTKYLGGDVRVGTSGFFRIRCHIWLSDTDIITWKELLPFYLPTSPSVLQEYAEDVRERIMEHVALELRARTDKVAAAYRARQIDLGPNWREDIAEMDKILDEANRRDDEDQPE